MFACDLNDMSVGGLQKWAQELEAQVAAPNGRFELETAIRTRTGFNNPTLIVDLGSATARRERWKFNALLMSAGAAAVSAIIALVVVFVNLNGLRVAKDGLQTAKESAVAAQHSAEASQESARTSKAAHQAQIDKEKAEAQKVAIDEFEQHTLLAIIEDEAKKDKEGIGVPYDVIERTYLGKANAAKGMTIPKERLQTEEIRKTLRLMQTSGAVLQTTEDNYFPVRVALIPNAFLTHSVNRAVGIILAKLATTDGLAKSDLNDHVVKAGKVTEEEYRIALNTMLGTKVIVFDKEKKIWSAERPLPKDKQ